jgi:hypothetical protein
MNYLFGHCMSDHEFVGIFILLEVVYICHELAMR